MTFGEVRKVESMPLYANTIKNLLVVCVNLFAREIYNEYSTEFRGQGTVANTKEFHALKHGCAPPLVNFSSKIASVRIFFIC